MPRELPELSEYQMDRLRRFLRFELVLEDLHEPLQPQITFSFGRANLLHYSAAIPHDPIQVTMEQITRAVSKTKAGEISQRRLQQWATMLLLNDAFDWSGAEEDQISDLLNDIAARS